VRHYGHHPEVRSLELKTRGRTRARRSALTVLALMALLAWAGQAYAQTPSDASAVDQYVEDVPTSQGSTRPGQGKSTKTTIAPSVSSQIDAEGGSDADLLREVASSSDYGAPQKAKPRKAKPKAKADGPKRSIRTDDGAPVAGPEDPSAGEAISAAASAVQGGDASRLVALLIALFVITLAALAAAGIRQKRRSS
jgi:cobalamin biosynthesis Mg chelatase CobN